MGADRAYLIATLITAVIAAPLIEEARVSWSRHAWVPEPDAARVPAILPQGVLFGVAHVDPVRGSGNVGLAIVLSRVGVAFGVSAYLTRRLGPDRDRARDLQRIAMLVVLTGWLDGVDSPFESLIGHAAAALASGSTPSSRLSISRTSPNHTAVSTTAGASTCSTRSRVCASTTSTYSALRAARCRGCRWRRQRGHRRDVRRSACRPATSCSAREITTAASRSAGVSSTLRLDRAETVVLAYGRHPDDLDAEVEVADHASDDRELLEVLLPEHRQVGVGDAEQLGDDGRDPAEVAGSHRPLEAFGQPARHDVRLEARRVHRRGRRRVHGVDARLRQASRSSSIGRG